MYAKQESKREETLASWGCGPSCTAVAGKASGCALRDLLLLNQIRAVARLIKAFQRYRLASLQEDRNHPILPEVFMLRFAGIIWAYTRPTPSLS